MALTKVTGQVIKNTTDVTVGVLTVTNTLAVGGTVSIGGTLTYEDVTNVDAVGIITARSNILVGSGITLSPDGDVFTTGVSTFSGAVTIDDGLNIGGNLSIPDKIIHAGDTNTAIRFPAADTITAETGGSERIRVDSDGKIGVNVTTPQKLLDVRGEFAISNNNTSYWDFDRDDSDGSLKIKDTGTERLRIDTSGRVLIGSTTADDAAQMLKVARTSGTARLAIQAANDGSSQLDFADVADADIGRIQYDHNSNYMALVTNNSERLRIDSSGRLLLGTTTEGVANADDLTIATSGHTGITLRAGTTFQSAIYMSDATSGNGEYAGYVLYDHNVDALRFGANTSERLRIDASGFMGLNTNNPSSFNLYARDLVVARSSGDAGITISAEDVSSEYGSLHFSGGTTVRSYIDVQNGSSGRMFLMNKMDGYMGFGTNNTERVRITSGGKFNIGDSANTGYSLKVKATGSDTNLARFESTTGAVDGVEVSFYHNTASPADGDQTGYLQFTGNDDGGNSTIYNAIIGYTTDVSNGSEDGDLRFFCRDNATFSQKLSIASDGTFTGSSSNDISDQRLKDNIATVVDPITKIKALKGRTFTWKPEAKLPAGTKYGFIAQEVETVVSDLVDDKHGIRQFDKDGNLIPEDENGKINTDEGTTDSKSVNAIGVVPILVEALKETLVKIETLETRLNNAGIAT